MNLKKQPFVKKNDGKLRLCKNLKEKPNTPCMQYRQTLTNSQIRYQTHYTESHILFETQAVLYYD